MTSHYLNKIYARAVLTEGVIDDDLQQQMLKTLGNDAWWTSHRLNLIKKLFSDDASLLSDDLKSYVPDACKYAKRMYKNIDAMVHKSLNEEDAYKYPWITNSNITAYILACDRFAMNEAPYALQWFRMCNEMVLGADTNYADAALEFFNQPNNEWVNIMSNTMDQYCKHIAKGKRVAVYEQVMDKMLNDFVQEKDADKRNAFDKLFGDAVFVTYVFALQQRWPAFEQVIGILPSSWNGHHLSRLGRAVNIYSNKFNIKMSKKTYEDDDQI